MIPLRARHVAVAVIAMVSIALCACIGQKVRDTVGVETLGLVATSVLEDAAAGIPNLPPGEQANAAGKIAAFETAIGSKDRTTITADALPRWPDIRAMAEAGIASREASGSIGPGVAASKRERLAKYEALLNRTAGVQ